MAIWQQTEDTDPSGLWYAHCFCGVVGPLRPTRLAAVRDESAHHEACSARQQVAA